VKKHVSGVIIVAGPDVKDVARPIKSAIVLLPYFKVMWKIARKMEILKLLKKNHVIYLVVLWIAK
jgi:hypothetical protein